MTKSYITIIQFKQTGIEVACGSVKTAVEWLNKHYPYLRIKASDVWNAKLAEGNRYELNEISIRKVRKIG